MITVFESVPVLGNAMVAFEESVVILNVLPEVAASETGLPVDGATTVTTTESDPEDAVVGVN